MRRRTGSRSRERGFTLIEALVTLSLLAIVGAAIGVVFSVGLRSILAPGASRDRIAAASDAISFEQLLTEDVHRATCIEAQTGGPAGSCATEASPFQGRCTTGSDTSIVACIEWPDITTASQCDVAIYSQLLPADTVSRSLWSGGMQQSTVAVTTTSVNVSTSISSPTALSVTVTSSVLPLANPPTLTFILEPLATQPWPADPLTGGSTGPC